MSKEQWREYKIQRMGQRKRKDIVKKKKGDERKGKKKLIF